MTLPSTDPAERLLAELEGWLGRADLGHIELTSASGVRLRIDVVKAGPIFYWITFIAGDDAEFEMAFAAKAAMRSFPWTMPFRPKLEREQASLPVLCRWQRAYVEDTAALCLTLLTKHFRVPLESVQVSGAELEERAVKSQKAWLGDVTAWFMQSRQAR